MVESARNAVPFLMTDVTVATFFDSFLSPIFVRSTSYSAIFSDQHRSASLLASAAASHLLDQQAAGGRASL